MHARSEPPRRTPLTDDLRGLLDRTGDRGTTIRGLIEALQERGTAVLIIMLAAPFVPPIPLPGLSIPFGAAIAVLGVRLALGRPAWLPSFLLRRPIRAATLANLVHGVERVARPLEVRLRPRWLFLFSPVPHALAGVAISIGALLLLPPLPMPGINALPSLAIVLLALGVMERDGVALAAGYGVLVLSYAYLYLWSDVAFRLLPRFFPL